MLRRLVGEHLQCQLHEFTRPVREVLDAAPPFEVEDVPGPRVERAP